MSDKVMLDFKRRLTIRAKNAHIIFSKNAIQLFEDGDCPSNSFVDSMASKMVSKRLFSLFMLNFL